MASSGQVEQLESGRVTKSNWTQILVTFIQSLMHMKLPLLQIDAIFATMRPALRHVLHRLIFHYLLDRLQLICPWHQQKQYSTKIF